MLRAMSTKQRRRDKKQNDAIYLVLQRLKREKTSTGNAMRAPTPMSRRNMLIHETTPKDDEEQQ